MDDYGGRPHWGKLHFQTAETLAPRYPRVGPVPGGAAPARPRRPLRQRLHPPRPRRPLTANSCRDVHTQIASDASVRLVDGGQGPGDVVGRVPDGEVELPAGGAARTGPTRTTAARRRPRRASSGSGGHVQAGERGRRPPRAEPPGGAAPAPAVGAAAGAAPRHPRQRLADVELGRPGPGARPRAAMASRWSPSTQRDLDPAVGVAGPVPDQLGAGRSAPSSPSMAGAVRLRAAPAARTVRRRAAGRTWPGRPGSRPARTGPPTARSTSGSSSTSAVDGRRRAGPRRAGRARGRRRRRSGPGSSHGASSAHGGSTPPPRSAVRGRTSRRRR